MFLLRFKLKSLFCFFPEYIFIRLRFSSSSSDSIRNGTRRGIDGQHDFVCAEHDAQTKGKYKFYNCAVQLGPFLSSFGPETIRNELKLHAHALAHAKCQVKCALFSPTIFTSSSSQARHYRMLLTFVSYLNWSLFHQCESNGEDLMQRHRYLPSDGDMISWARKS